MFTSGFFNSVNSDRRYNAEQMSAIFDGLITQGIFDSIGDHFQVKPGSGLTVTVGTGRAWLNQTWSYNDSLYPLQLSAASPTLGRKDLVCIKVDKSTNVRANSIVLIEGTPASTPVEPTVTDDTTNGIYYHKLAAVTVQAGATEISAADIYNYIGLSTGTPYVTGIIETTSVDELWSQWDGEFNDWWENTIKPIINTETVTRLQNNIDHITAKEATMNLYGFSHINPPPSGKTYQEYSTDAILNQINTLLSQKANTSALNSYVPTSRTVNGKALSSNITLSTSDVGAIGIAVGSYTGSSGSASSEEAGFHATSWSTKYTSLSSIKMAIVYPLVPEDLGYATYYYNPSGSYLYGAMSISTSAEPGDPICLNYNGSFKVRNTCYWNGGRNSYASYSNCDSSGTKYRYVAIG